MKKNLLLFISIFFFQVFYGQEKWDQINHEYINYDYNFAWNLGKELNWEKVMGTSKKTVFRAKCQDVPIIVFVMPHEYNKAYEDIDIWEKAEEMHDIEKIKNENFLKIGYKEKELSFKKVSFSGKHAIKVITQTEGVDEGDLAIEKDTKISVKTIHNGWFISVCILTLSDVYEGLLKEGVDIESLFQGFSFIYDKRLENMSGSNSYHNKFNGKNIGSYNISERDRINFSNGMMSFCEDMNKQTPVKVDEITTLYSMAYFNQSLKAFYKVDLSVNDFSKEDIDNMKDSMKQSQKAMVKQLISALDYKVTSKDMYEAMKAFNLKVCCVYRDVDDNFIFETKLTCEDFK